MRVNPLMIMALGSLIGILFPEILPIPIWVIGGLLFCSLLIGGYSVLFWKKGLFYTLFFVSLCFFAWYTQFLTEQNISELSEEAGIAEGSILNFPAVDGNRVRLRLEVERWNEKEISEEIELTIRLHNQEEWKAAHQLHRKMRLKLPVKLSKPEPIRNPGGFDYKGYLKRQGVHWLATAEWEEVKIISTNAYHPVVHLDRLRAKISNRLEALFPQQEHAGLFQALLLGEREKIPAAWEEIFSTLGLVHILSISGLHVSLLTMLSYEGWKLLGLTREKAVFLTLLLLPCYVILTGADAPIIRAALMGALALVALWLRKWSDATSFLYFALLVLLLGNPFQIYELGFQLTFLVTWGLLIAVEPISHVIPLPFARFRIAVAVALVAEVISFPIIISTFHEYSLLSGVINLFFVPFYTILLPIAIVLLMIGLFSLSLSIWLAKWITVGINFSQEMLASLLEWKVHIWTFPTPPAVWFICYISCAVITWFLWTHSLQNPRLRLPRFALLGLLICLVIVAAKWELWTRKETRITFLDVGQGDAILIETVDGKAVLVDSGGTIPFPKKEWEKVRDPYDVGKRVVIPALKARGISKLDAIILTHGDLDHIGGFQAVVERFPVDVVWRNPHISHSEYEKRLMQQIDKKGIPIATLKLGEMIPLGQQVVWQVLHPDPDRLLGDRQKTNNDSLVGLLMVDQTTILLTGDVEKEAERAILSRYDLPAIDVLKVAHHGSNTSTEERWLQELSPTIAVISVGKKNRYGHPHRDVINRLQNYGVEIYRTDEDGAITLHVQSNGNYRMETLQ